MAAAMRLIEAVRLAVEGGFDAKADRLRDLAYAQVNGALSTLDPHTVLWPPEAAREWSEDNIQGQFYGIGAFLNQDEGLISIQRVMPGLPAERAGVEDGDVILAVDGEKTAGLTLDQAVRRIKGPKGTTVNLTLERKGLKSLVDLPIVRDLVKVITMRQYRDGGVGYVRMDDFNANTAQDLLVALRELKKDGPLQVLVLDLRFNGGGLLDQAKLIGAFFLARGQEVVRTTTVDGKEDVTINRAGRFVTAPMVVLTSPGTASAAEIVAGALQLNERAVIAGEASFGKGSVQNIRDLRDGSRLKLTIQEYLLPGGASIQDVGVSPDIQLLRRAVREDGTVDLRDLSSERERDNEFALGGHKNYDRQPVAELTWLDPWLDREARRVHTIAAREFRPDRESQVIIDLCKAACAAEDWAPAMDKALAEERLRPFLIERLKAPLAARAETEAAALADALGRLPKPIVWGPGGVPVPDSLTVSWAGPETVTAGETVALAVQVANRGASEVGRLLAVVHADPLSPFWEEEFVVGVVPAGGTATGLLHFQIPPRLPAGEERFTVELMQDSGKQPLATCPVTLRITPRPSPHLSLGWKVVEDNGDGRLSPEERADLVVEVLNDGDGALEAGAVWVEKDNDPYVSLGASRQKVDTAIAPGASRKLTFPLKVLKEAKRNGQPVALTAERIKLNIAAVEILPDGVDARYRATVRVGIEIPIGQPLQEHHLVQPTIIARAPQADGARTRLDFSIADASKDPLVPPLDLVALFQGEDKVDLQVASALDGPVEGRWTYAPRITLKPGLNQLRLLVRDSDGMVNDRVMRLWGPDAPVAPTVAKPVPVAPALLP
jgi:carboxyl-terminal processing protease